MSPAPSSSPTLLRCATVALPLANNPPAFAMEAGRLIHVLAMDSSNRRAVHVALDRDGAAASPPRTLPISLASAGTCGDAVITSGVHDATGARWVLGLDATGATRWETELPIPTAGLVWVLPICIAGDPAIVWEVEKNTTADLGVATLRGGRLGRAVISSQANVAFGLSVAAIGASVFVLRARGSERSAEILRIDDGTVTARAHTVKNAHGIAAIGDRLAVLSW